MTASTICVRTLGAWVLMLAILQALTAPAFAAEDASAETQAILDTAGVSGGLIVHLGCGDGRLTAALRANDGCVVQGLDADPANVQAARDAIREAGVYGPVSADVFRGGVLPYTDNLVNLLVVEDLDAVSLDEIRRVLAPSGVAMVHGPSGWKRTVKPRPDTIDDWTHYLHGPDGNAVSRDKEVNFLERMQWLGGPKFSRHHDHMSAVSAMVTAGGRLFYICDHASPLSIQLPSDWRLVARDAFNGTVLWQREMKDWYSQLQKLKSGPPDVPRRLVAIGDTVYATLALDAKVEAIDAATGETIKVYDATQGADEILIDDGVMHLVVNRKGYIREPFTEWTPEERILMAVDLESGEKLWEKAWPWVAPGCMAVADGRAVFFDGERLVALDTKSGDVLWQSEKLGERGPIPVFFAPCLVLKDDHVVFSGADSDAKAYHADNGQTMYTLAADTGKTLWTAPHAPSGYRSAEDLFVIDGLVWTSDVFNSQELRSPRTGTVWGRDLATGEVKVEFMPDVDTHWFHHRCHRGKATEDFLLTSRTGIEFVDFREEHWTCHHWARSACLYGVMPANGMIYNAPHPCACYLEAKLFGFNALAAKSEQRDAIVETALRQERLEKGPAYGMKIETFRPNPKDWPTLRADGERSGRISADVPADVDTAWQTTLGGKLSAPVVVDGTLFVAQIDEHTVHALDARTGASRWSYTTGARVDSPPTIWNGRVLFGSADGHVYCLNANDGALMWRFRAAPADLRMGAFNQLESVWPVHGSVLVRKDENGRDVLWTVAGRSMFLDGGMRLIRLDPASGELIAETVLDDKVPGTDDNLQTALKALNMPVALSDVLVSDGANVYMKSQQFDLDGNRIDIEVPNLQAREQKGETAHLFCPTGLLDDIWWHRSYWLYGRVWKSGAGGYYQSGRYAPAGRPLVFDDSTVYGFGRQPSFYRWTTSMEYMLYASPKQPAVKKVGDKPKGFAGGAKPDAEIETAWAREVPMFVRAMVMAGDKLFLAGPPDLIDEVKTLRTFNETATQEQLARQAAVIEGTEGALLWTVSAKDGTKLAERELDAVPNFDSLIAAGDRLFYTTLDGRVVSMGK